MKYPGYPVESRLELCKEVVGMECSEFDPAEFWNQHVKKLQTIQSATDQEQAHLEVVREKRASPRIRSLNLASYVPKMDERQEYIISIGRTLDVSQGGAKIETHRKLDRGMQLDLEIAVEDQIISAKGEVLYSKNLGHGLFGTGIRFTSIAEEDRRLLHS